GTFVTFTPVSESTLSQVGKPTGETFPYGFMAFNVIGLTPGQTIHITQTYPGPIPANAKYWKVENGVWSDATSLISISGNTVTLTLTDGGFGDSDGLANGQISDPSGLGFPPLVSVTLGSASTFSILASTYTNTAPGVVINGDLGYTTGPAVLPIIFGTTYVAPNFVYSQAGVDEGIALPALNALSCNHSFGGITNLSLLPQPLVPGVYCISSAMSVGTGGITLNGAGTYVFRSTGALDTAASSHMVLTGGADASNVYWTPGAATTLGANSNFFGTDIDDSGITIGANVDITGRALAFGGTISTDADTFTIPLPPVAPIQFSFPTGSGSNSPSESRPSLGGVLLHTFSDGLRINGHVFDISKFNNPVPQQVLPLDKPVSIIIKQSMTRGAFTWQHEMLFMNFNGKDTTTGNADTWISLDKHDGVQVHDPNGFVTDVSIHNDFAAYDMNTTFTFTPVKQMSDSNMIIRVWDNRLSQTDAHVNGALLFGDAPITAAPLVKPDWIQVFTSMTDADNVIENAGFDKPVLFSHISTASQVWTQPNTGHVLWFYDSKDLQVARVIYDASGNVVGETVEPLINSTNVIMGKDTSHAGNHLSRENSGEMTKALAQQQSHAQQTIDRLGYNR
ncbi:MAG TPA: ice-binding family protein, partial [Candidatus Nitrosotalea sp.]|nr:ice-binding family protein [Candidatus Nitrosotalea sp.]